MDRDLERVLHNLTLHPPKSADAGSRMDTIRDSAKAFAIAICASCPGSRERSLALTHLEETTQWAIAAIARNQEDASVE